MINNTLIENEEQELSNQVDVLTKQVNELNDKYLRAVAELQNYQKQTQKRTEALVDYSTAVIYNKLLPIMDDFERAKENNDLSTGTELVYKAYKDLFNDLGIEEIRPKPNDVFDTELHNAVAVVPPIVEENKNTIAVVQKIGYKWKDKILRFADVIVFKEKIEITL